MAIRAFDVLAIHFALQKRAVLENLVANLPIIVIEIPVEQMDHFVIGQLLPRLQASRNQRTA